MLIMFSISSSLPPPLSLLRAHPQFNSHYEVYLFLDTEPKMAISKMAPGTITTVGWIEVIFDRMASQVFLMI